MKKTWGRGVRRVGKKAQSSPEGLVVNIERLIKGVDHLSKRLRTSLLSRKGARGKTRGEEGGEIKKGGGGKGKGKR